MRGGIRSDVTVARLADERFLIGGNGPRDVAWLRRHLPPEGDVTVTDVTESTCCAALWGPAACEILTPIADLDVPYMGTGETEVGGVPVIATRISYVGELGWELVAEVERGPVPRRDRGGARGARLPPVGEGLPSVGDGHDARARIPGSRSRMDGAA